MSDELPIASVDVPIVDNPKILLKKRPNLRRKTVPQCELPEIIPTNTPVPITEDEVISAKLANSGAGAGEEGDAHDMESLDTFIICNLDQSISKMNAEMSIKKFEHEKSKNTTTLININNYTKKFEAYPSDLVVFVKENNLQLPPLTSMRGQALALMSQAEVRGQKHIGREQAVKFFENIGMKTTDAIQQFNKPTGLKRLKMRANYCLQYPFESDTTDLDKRKGVSISGDRDSYIDYIKAWWRKNLVDVPNNEWQIGHLDPTISDASEKNLAYQPPIQGKYRNRFKFDHYFIKMWPTADELIPNIDKYYTDKEQMELYESLKKKYEK